MYSKLSQSSYLFILGIPGFRLMDVLARPFRSLARKKRESYKKKQLSTLKTLPDQEALHDLLIDLS